MRLYGRPNWAKAVSGEDGRKAQRLASGGKLLAWRARVLRWGIGASSVVLTVVSN